MLSSKNAKHPAIAEHFGLESIVYQGFKEHLPLAWWRIICAYVTRAGVIVHWDSRPLTMFHQAPRKFCISAGHPGSSVPGNLAVVKHRLVTEAWMLVSRTTNATKNQWPGGLATDLAGGEASGAEGTKGLGQVCGSCRRTRFNIRNGAVDPIKHGGNANDGGVFSSRSIEGSNSIGKAAGVVAPASDAGERPQRVISSGGYPCWTNSWKPVDLVHLMSLTLYINFSSTDDRSTRFLGVQRT
jgi:hypothetical protein